MVFMTIKLNKRTDADNEFLTMDRIVKIRSTIEKHGEESFFISFSGGKDSTVLSHLVDLAIPDNHIPRVFADTGIELNAIKEFVLNMQKVDPRMEIIKPSVNIRETLERDGYPFKSKEHSDILSIYQRHGMTRASERYLWPDESRKSFGCPQKLKYQFSPDFKLKCSQKCCYNMKKKPINDYADRTGRHNMMIGILGDEKGGRSNAKCMVMKGKNLHFQPLTAVDSQWEEYFIEKEQIKLCKVYYEPYNFDRTGCKGCPYNIKLQQTLDVLEKYFPAERKQCELIWAPVYEEYRRIGYRLRSN